jgi:uncharacterized protein (DUF433 family)
MAITHATTHSSEATPEALDAMIVQDPRRPGRHNARMRDYGTHVWALVASLQGNDWDVAKVAANYHMPEIAIRAAIQYYEKNRVYIDAELLLQHEEFVSE